ncbi:hypothetical protein [Clostridium sp.]|uniref:hypothetical protein n=1 Tax=Clostridium sp. TaxID=1506 RepID=UPI00399462AE
MDLKFLDEIELKELEGKEEIIKSVRFTKEEFYLLKYLHYKNKRFSYVKNLIERDLQETIEPPVNNISKKDIKNLIKETLKTDDELKEIIRDILKEDEEEIVIEEKKEDISEAKKDLIGFMTGKNK